MKDDFVYISQILDSISKIETYTEGMDEEAFRADGKTQSAVIMHLILIGEVVKKMSDSAKSNIDIPWKDIAGFRDRAIHNYFEIDLDVVWNTILQDLPVLKDKLKQG